MSVQASRISVQAVNDLANLTSVALLLAAAVLALVMLLRWARGKPARRPAIAAIVCVAAYGMLLLTLSLTSRAREILPGTEKCFDDWCVTVSGVRTLPNQQAMSGGKLVAVSFRVVNRAQRAAFRPSQPRVSLVVPDGRVLTPFPAAQREFERQAGPQDDLARDVMAGEQFQTTLVFDAPPDVRKGWIVVLEGPPVVTRFLAGDENSFLHKKIMFPISID